MSSSTNPTVDSVSTDNSPKHNRRRVVAQALAGLGVLALALLLLGWGLSATQWTILSTNNNLTDAVNNGVLFGSYTSAYSIPQGVERDITVRLYFQPSSPGLSSSSDINSSNYSLAQPVSSSTTTIQYYALFTFTNPNGSAVNVWYTGPQGNITQDCSSGILVAACLYSPSPAGSSTGPYMNFFQTPTAGNYTMHLLSTPSTATLRISRALSLVVYNRPYYNTGLATEIVAGIATAAAIAYLSVTAARTLQKRPRKTRPPSAAPPIIND